MDARIWIAEALSGDIIGELHGVSGDFTQKFGGGTANALVPLAHLTRQGSQEVDWPAVAHLIDMVSTGKRTLVLTVDTNVIGEWLIMNRPESVNEGTIQVEAMEWDGYPALRSLHASYEYASTDQLIIAHQLLVDAFTGWQEAFQITIPNQTSGVKRSVKWRQREGYYSDALDEISLPEDGFDWRLIQTGTWLTSALKKVNRVVKFGSPTIERSSPIVVRHDGPATRSGNALRFNQTIDSRRYLHSVYAFGAGDGAKQLFYEAANDTLSHQGHVKITKNLSYPNITSQANLKALADAVLAAGQELRLPATAELIVDKLPQLPQLGDRIQTKIAPTWTVPTGHSGTMRVGEITYPIAAGHLNTVKIGAL